MANIVVSILFIGLVLIFLGVIGTLALSFMIKIYRKAKYGKDANKEKEVK